MTTKQTKARPPSVNGRGIRRKPTETKSLPKSAFVAGVVWRRFLFNRRHVCSWIAKRGSSSRPKFLPPTKLFGSFRLLLFIFRHFNTPQFLTFIFFYILVDLVILSIPYDKTHQQVSGFPALLTPETEANTTPATTGANTTPATTGAHRPNTNATTEANTTPATTGANTTPTTPNPNDDIPCPNNYAIRLNNNLYLRCEDFDRYYDDQRPDEKISYLLGARNGSAKKH